MKSVNTRLRKHRDDASIILTREHGLRISEVSYVFGQFDNSYTARIKFMILQEFWPLDKSGEA